jgi:hypothetical protein
LQLGRSNGQARLERPPVARTDHTLKDHFVQVCVS